MEFSFLHAGDVRFSLNGTTYQNNSLVTLEDIGENNTTTLLCRTNFNACCRPPYTALGNWFFLNGSRVFSKNSDEQSDFYRTRGEMEIGMHRRRGGEDGIYHCEIPDSMNVTQTIYIGVYAENSGE